MTAVGFTGTRAGMTLPQQNAVQLLLLQLGATDLHHGDCIGGDDQADQIGRELGLLVHIHPPSDPSKRAWCNTRPIGETWTVPAQPYLLRNQAIVDTVQAMIGAPKDFNESRSGTWSTIRYARQRRRPVWVIWPSGSLTTPEGTNV